MASFLCRPSCLNEGELESVKARRTMVNLRKNIGLYLHGSSFCCFNNLFENSLNVQCIQATLTGGDEIRFCCEDWSTSPVIIFLTYMLVKPVR